MSWFRSVVCFLTLSAVAAPGHAQERAVTFAEALALADRHPTVQGDTSAARELEKARERAPVVDENPTISLALGPRITPESEHGIEGRVGVRQGLSLVGSASARREALGVESRWMGAEASARRLEHRLATAGAWVDLWTLAREVTLMRQTLETERTLLAYTERLQAAGEVTRAEVAVARVRLAEAELRERSSEGKWVDARSALAIEIGDEGGLPRAEGPLPELAPPSASERARLLREVATLPSLRAKQWLARAELVRGREESAARGSRLDVGVEFERDALNAGVLLGTLTLRAPLFDVGERERAARNASRMRWQGDATGELRSLRGTLTALFHELEHTEEVLLACSERLLPAAERARALRQRELEQGEGTLLEVMDAERTLLDARLRRLLAERDRALARIKVQLFLGELQGESR